MIGDLLIITILPDYGDATRKHNSCCSYFMFICLNSSLGATLEYSAWTADSILMNKVSIGL